MSNRSSTIVPVPVPLPLPSLPTSASLIKATFHPSSYGSINRSDRADSIDMDVHTESPREPSPAATVTPNPTSNIQPTSPKPHMSSSPSPSDSSSSSPILDSPSVQLSTASLHNAIIILLLLVSAGIILHYLSRNDIRVILSTLIFIILGCVGLRGTFRHDVKCLLIYWVGLSIWTGLFIILVITVLTTVGVTHYAETRCGSSFPSYASTPNCIHQVEQSLMIIAIGGATTMTIIMLLVISQGYRLWRKLISMSDTEFATVTPLHTHYMVIAGTLAAPVVKPGVPSVHAGEDDMSGDGDGEGAEYITRTTTQPSRTFGHGVVGARDSATTARIHKPATFALNETGVRRRHVPSLAIPIGGQPQPQPQLQPQPQSQPQHTSTSS